MEEFRFWGSNTSLNQNFGGGLTPFLDGFIDRIATCTRDYPLAVSVLRGVGSVLM